MAIPYANQALIDDGNALDALRPEVPTYVRRVEPRRALHGRVIVRGHRDPSAAAPRTRWPSWS
jgi:hypothetical protein